MISNSILRVEFKGTGNFLQVHVAEIIKFEPWDSAALKSDCGDAQADLELHYSHMSKDPFLHDTSHIYFCIVLNSHIEKFKKQSSIPMLSLQSQETDEKQMA